MSDFIVRDTSNPTIEQSQEALNFADVTMPTADADFRTRETHNENDVSGYTGKNATFTKYTVHDTNEGLNGDDTHPEHPLQDDDNYGSKVGGEHFQDDVAGYATALANNTQVRAKNHLGAALPATYLNTTKAGEKQLMPCDIDLPKPTGKIKMDYDNKSIKIPSSDYVSES